MLCYLSGILGIQIIQWNTDKKNSFFMLCNWVKKVYHKNVVFCFYYENYKQELKRSRASPPKLSIQGEV